MAIKAAAMDETPYPGSDRSPNLPRPPSPPVPFSNSSAERHPLEAAGTVSDHETSLAIDHLLSEWAQVARQVLARQGKGEGE